MFNFESDTTLSYAICAPCRATGVESVNRYLSAGPVPLGQCAHCGGVRDDIVAQALASIPGAHFCRDCRAVCWSEVPCGCCLDLADMHAEEAC